MVCVCMYVMLLVTLMILGHKKEYTRYYSDYCGKFLS
jgi:hypothetical protein